MNEIIIAVCNYRNAQFSLQFARAEFPGFVDLHGRYYQAEKAAAAELIRLMCEYTEATWFATLGGTRAACVRFEVQL